ncbi:MAG TPA: arsenic resistance N-acetyltransferase ArsN2 [Rhizobacter sp.]
MSLNTVSLRQAGAADWPAIASLLSAHQLPLDGAQEHLQDYVVAHQGPEIVGVAGAEVRGDVALLRSVAVAPGLQRRGVGGLLVSTVLDEARRRGIRQIFLLTTTAPDFFKRHGFGVRGRSVVPAALQASAEFRGACPASATLMGLTLQDAARPDRTLPVAVIGAGPVGLAAAARLIDRGLPLIILEAGAGVGTHLADYGHVRLFSPWRYNLDPAMSALLAPTGWVAPPLDEMPLAQEVVDRVLKPFAALPEVAAALHLDARVESISREGFDKVKSAGRDTAPFVIRAIEKGRPVEYRARAVIDASGTWSTPNPLGANGLPALGETECADRIFYGIPDVLGRDRARYAGRRTLVVGAGHSAANALLGLAELAQAEPGTRLAWAVRTPTLARVFGGGAADALPARGQLGSDLRRLRDRGGLEFLSGLRITSLQHEGAQLRVDGLDAQGRPVRLEGIDEIICATGQRPDLSLSRELRVKLDPWLESAEALGPLIDPNLHSCGTVRPHGHRELAHPETGFYAIGVKSYGRAPTFLMATGYEQARSVVAAIDGDIALADRVELELPETGVCSATVALPAQASAQAGCCGGPAKADASACCALDETKKAQGEAGCGCNAPAPALATMAATAAPARAATGSRCCG